jgi:outer membrane protein assembly factor BamB
MSVTAVAERAAMTGIAFGPGGEVAVAGTFAGTLELAGTTLTATGGDDAFVARLGPGGERRWLVPLGGPGAEVAPLVAVVEERVIAALGFHDQLAIGNQTLSGRGEPASAVAAFGQAGALEWATLLESSRYVRVTAIDAGTDGAVVAGLFAGTMRAGDRVLTSAGTQDAFVVRLAPDGQVRWAMRAGGPFLDAVHGVALGDGMVAIAGAFTIQAELRGATLQGSRDSQDAFVAALDDRDGQVRWARPFGSDGPDTAFDVVIAGDQVFAAGTFFGTLTVAGHSLTSRGSTDWFVIALGGGELVWAQRFGGTGADEVHRLALADDRLWAAGSFTGTAPLGPADLTSAGGHDLFLVSIDPRTGAAISGQRFGGAGQDALADLAAGPGRVGIAGSFRGTHPIPGQQPSEHPSGFAAVLGTGTYSSTR